MILHNAVHDRKAQARALAGGLGGEEGIVDAVQGCAVHAAAIVAEEQADVGSRGERERYGGVIVGKFGGIHADFDQAVASGSDGVGGIGGQVDDDLVDLR